MSKLHKFIHLIFAFTLLTTSSVAMSTESSDAQAAAVQPAGQKIDFAQVAELFQFNALTAQTDTAAANFACGRDGTPCDWGHECCSGNCNTNDVCGSGAFCEGNGASCNWDHECCSGICNNGSCSLSRERECKAVGESCDWGHECCNGNCNTNDVCGDGAFCEGVGASCNWDHECCSNHCSSNGKCG